MYRKTLLLFAAIALVLTGLTPDLAQAAKKKRKKKKPTYVLVSENDLFGVNVGIKVSKKKTRSIGISCLNTTAGEVKNAKDGLRFTSFQTLYKKFKKKKKLSRATYYKKLASAGRSKCVKPDFASLDPFKGNFGIQQAQAFCDRFLFGCTREELDRIMRDGLDATIARVTRYQQEPAIDAIVADLQCDGRLPNDENNEECDAYNPNDIYLPGVRYGWYYEVLHGGNRFFNNLEFFLHDERAAVSTSALQGCERHAVLGYMDLLKRAAIGGDIKQYCADFAKDHFGHVRWLSGDGSYKTAPNEDFGRELLELLCMSPTDLDGNPVYDDLDIANSALAMTGFLIEGRTVYPPGGDEDGYYVCYSGYFPGRHSGGPKVLFHDTPNQMIVNDYSDTPLKVFDHPHTAEAWARDLWYRYINDKPTKSSLVELAKVIRQSNYNLVQTMKTIMKSRAVYDEGSRKTIIKHPMEFFLGFLIQTGMPVSYSTIDDILDDLGERIFLAPSVFGWYEKKLAGEFRVLDARNSILRVTNQDLDDLQEEYGFSFQDRWMDGLSKSARSIVDRVGQVMGVKLNEAQKQSLDRLMDYRLIKCNQWDSKCSQNQEYREEYDAFDPHPDNADATREKMRNLIDVLAMLPDYRVKN